MAVTAIFADGWRATYPGGESATFTPDTSPELVPVTRAGFDATGATTTFVENLVVTTGVRSPYAPTGWTNASREINQAALSDYVYAADVVTVGGSPVTNNSTWVSPKPVANWAMADKLLVGSTMLLEVVAFHRNGIAAVVFTVVDGAATSRTYTVTTPTVSVTGYDRHAVLTYRVLVDTSAYADGGAITVNAKVYPKVGVPNGTYSLSSINDSSLNGSNAREFTARTFFRSAARAAAPPVAYVLTSGNDATGVWSTTPATAEATAFSSIKGALDNINTAVRGAAAQTGFAFGDAGGCELRIGEGAGFVPVSTTSTKTNANGIRIVVTRDPNKAVANCIILQNTATAWSLKCGDTHFRQITMSRTSTGSIASGISALFEDVVFDNGGQSSSWLGTSAGTGDLWLGGTITGTSGNALTAASVAEHRLWRGVSIPGAVTTVEGWNVLGCDMGQAGAATLQLTYGTGRMSGAILHGNRFNGINSSSGLYAVSQTVEGFAEVQNLVEPTHTTAATRSVGISPDGQANNTKHVIIWHRTSLGAYTGGRDNDFYDEGATPRTNDLMSVKGNIFVAFNIKGDVFTTDGSRLGNRAATHGVGFAGNYSMFATNGSSERQVFTGLSCKINVTSDVVRQNTTASLFTNYQSMVNTGSTITSAGSGGGTYTLATGSAAAAMVPTSPLPFDFAGSPRSPTLSSAGAYSNLDIFGVDIGAVFTAPAATVVGTLGAVTAASFAGAVVAPSAVCAGGIEAAPTLIEAAFAAPAASVSAAFDIAGSQGGTVWTLHLPAASTIVVIQD